MSKNISQSILIIILVFTSTTAFGQYTPIIGSGRPGNANGAATTGKGVLQFQAGIQIAGANNPTGINNGYNEFSENLVIRYGLTELFEISAVINQANVTSTFSGEETKTNGFNTTMLRARLKVIDNLAVQVGLDLPILENDFVTDYPAPQIKIMYNTVFSDKLNLTTNLGAQWDGVNENPAGFYVFSFSAALPAKFSLILESYGDFKVSRLNHYYDAGIGYLLNPDFLFDLNAGWGRNFGVESYFVTTGVSFRFNTANRE